MMKSIWPNRLSFLLLIGLLFICYWESVQSETSEEEAKTSAEAGHTRNGCMTEDCQWEECKLITASGEPKCPTARPHKASGGVYCDVTRTRVKIKCCESCTDTSHYVAQAIKNPGK